jgi:hypothetical protein
MWFWIGVAVVAVAVYGLLRWKSRGGDGPRGIYETKEQLLRRWEDPGDIDRHGP